MTNEEKYRLEEPEKKEDQPVEKKGFFRPLPQSVQKTRVKGGKAQPIVKFLGISMYEKNRDTLVVILMPILTAIINVSIFSSVTLSLVQSWE